MSNSVADVPEPEPEFVSPFTRISQEIPQGKLREIFYMNEHKIIKVIEELKENNLKVFFIYTTDKRLDDKVVEAKIVLIDDNNEEKGHFTFSSVARDLGSGEGISLTIYIEEDLHSKGFAWLMVGSLIYMLKDNIKLFTTSTRTGSIGLNKDTILGIDSDASEGYWEYIGLQPGRYTWDLPETRRPGLAQSSFEKTTTLGELSKFVLDRPFEGGSKKKYKKYKKFYKTKKNKKINKKTTNKLSKKNKKLIKIK
jgi:hypothetical protein